LAPNGGTSITPEAASGDRVCESTDFIGAGPDMDLLLDLNFNAKTEGYVKIVKEIADFDMFWVEIDSRLQALAHIRRASPHPISSCETLLGLRDFLPYFREQAMDVAIIDAVWNGVGNRSRSPRPPMRSR